MKRSLLLLVLVCLALLGGECHADYLEVRRPAKLKSEPKRDAGTLLTLKLSVNLKLIDSEQREGYYYAETEDGRNGWVYRTLVRRFPGDPPFSTESISSSFSLDSFDMHEYYRRVDASNADRLRDTLHEVIDDHKRFPYSSNAPDTWDILERADEDPNDLDRVLDIYRNTTFLKAGGGNDFYNREHSWPKSHGFKIDGRGNYPFTDCHHLFICDTGYNSSRSNKPYNNVDITLGTEKKTEENNSVGGVGQSNWTKGKKHKGSWQVWPGRRGDVARAQFYLDIRYEGGKHSITNLKEPDLILTDDRGMIVPSSSNQDVGHMGMLSILLQWHRDDPVDANERKRNDVIYQFQGNRNPFIDHPEWVEILFE